MYYHYVFSLSEVVLFQRLHYQRLSSFRGSTIRGCPLSEAPLSEVVLFQRLHYQTFHCSLALTSDEFVILKLSRYSLNQLDNTVGHLNEI